MWCAKCNHELSECTCPDIEERLRSLSGESGPLVSRWCILCDKHYSQCKCEAPTWVMRMGGKLR
jgi:hypothetical protein